MLKRPKITLILLNYNNSRYLKKCLESIVCYRKNYHEIIFVDDCSKDATTQEYEQIIEKFPDLRIKSVFNSDNFGVKESLLNVLDFVDSDYVQLLGTDDLFGWHNILPDFTKNSNDVYVTGGFYINDFGVKLKRYNNSSLNLNFIAGLIYYSNPVKAPGIIASKDLVKESLQKTNVEFEDWPILRQSISNGGKIINSNKSIILYRQHSSSLSSKSNKNRIVWLSKQILIFLEESLDYDITPHTRFMINVQTVYISSGYVLRSFIIIIKALDLKKIAFKILNFRIK
jgi:glycosyltransferase involved in cell wall biosynthesis